MKHELYHCNHNTSQGNLIFCEVCLNSHHVAQGIYSIGFFYCSLYWCYSKGYSNIITSLHLILKNILTWHVLKIYSNIKKLKIITLLKSIRHTLKYISDYLVYFKHFLFKQYMDLIIIASKLTYILFNLD